MVREVEPRIADRFSPQCPDEIRSIQRMWREVLAEQIRLALLAVPADNPFETTMARRMLMGETGRKDLDLLLDLAGWDVQVFENVARPRLRLLFDAIDEGLRLRPEKLGRGRGRAKGTDADVLHEIEALFARARHVTETPVTSPPTLPPPDPGRGAGSPPGTGSASPA